ncbi:MAG: acyl-ACP desaturase [Chloroflexota bacterium]|nr:acyl-ACP desaturase [Chloroflexota bacterium]
MSKLAKRMSYPFTEGQPLLPATGRVSVPSKEDVIAFYRTHERVSWSLTEVIDLDWRDIDVDALTKTDIDVVETVMLVESNNPDYVANLLEYFKADQDVCDFVMMWAIEEWKHYYALREYLTKLQVALKARAAGPDARAASDLIEMEAAVHRALSEKVGDVRQVSGENWGIPAHYLPVQVVASTTLQEFMTAEFYRHHAQHTKEPVLAKIESLLAKDETRHEMFYEQKTKDCLAAEPGLMPLVIDALKEFGMPGANLLNEYDARQAAMEDAAYPTLAEKKGAFVAMFSKLTRVIGRDNAMRVFTEGNYLGGGSDTASQKKMRPELITRLITRKLSI